MGLTELLRTVGAGALDLVFAPACVACKLPITAADPQRLICRVCWSRARPIPAPRCSRCWSPAKLSPSTESAPCPLCATLPPRVRVARSAVVMEDRVREMVHGLKYGGWSALAGKLAWAHGSTAASRKMWTRRRGWSSPSPPAPLTCASEGTIRRRCWRRHSPAKRGAIWIPRCSSARALPRLKRGCIPPNGGLTLRALSPFPRSAVRGLPGHTFFWLMTFGPRAQPRWPARKHCAHAGRGW